MRIIEIVCTYPCVLLLSVFGIYFTFKSKFVQIRGMKSLFSENKKKESLSTFATALGGTVGVGSITGIGLAISEGGAGSIFWMWITSFFGMGIKYAETYVAVKFRNKNMGGAMVALEKAGYYRLGVAFALLAVCASLGGGNSAQSGAMAEAFLNVGISSKNIAFFSGILLFLVLIGGKKRIEKVNSVLVPVSSVLYVLGMTFILIKSGNNLQNAFSSIISEAFGIKQMSAGASAYLFSRALRIGTIRGVFSHEAGMGSSPIAHASGNGNPFTSGIWGVMEIYVDTFLVGTLTAFCLLCNETYSVPELFLKFFGNAGGVLFAFFMAVFAFAAVLSWCYYSEACIGFLTRRQKRSFTLCSISYKILATFTFALGCVAPLKLSWVASDILNCLMVFPNLFLIYIKRKEIFYDGGKILVDSKKRCVEKS